MGIQIRQRHFSDQVFTVGDQYVVARVSAIKPKGILSLDVKETN
jgi:hypothetical protein